MSEAEGARAPAVAAIEAGPLAASHVGKRTVLVYEAACPHAECEAAVLRLSVIQDYDAPGEAPRLTLEHVPKRGYRGG